MAEELAASPCYDHLLQEKSHKRIHDEARKPLEAYRVNDETNR